MRNARFLLIFCTKTLKEPFLPIFEESQSLNATYLLVYNFFLKDDLS